LQAQPTPTLHVLSLDIQESPQAFPVLQTLQQSPLAESHPVVPDTVNDKNMANPTIDTNLLAARIKSTFLVVQLINILE
jgi:hypothetical protein